MNCVVPVESAVSPLTRLKPSTVPAKPNLRPNLSMIGPQMVAPMNMPHIPAEASMPLKTGVSCHSLTIDGIAKPTM